MPRHGLLACVLHVGLRYDMMELIKLLNVENKVSNEDKRDYDCELVMGVLVRWLRLGLIRRSCV